MTSEQRRLKRTRLIERVRTVEQRESALAAAQAEVQRARLDAVSAKTRSLAAHYASLSNATDELNFPNGSFMCVIYLDMPFDLLLRDVNVQLLKPGNKPFHIHFVRELGGLDLGSNIKL